MGFAMLLAAIVLHTASPAFGQKHGPSVTLGPVEVVRNSTKITCGPRYPPPQTPGQHYNLDIPDEPCRAWKTPLPLNSSDGTAQEVHLLATHTAARYDHGPTLDNLQHDCRVAFNSSWNPDPSQFDDRTWLMSPWLSEAGQQTVYALAHMEFHGWSDVAGHALCINATSGQPATGKRVEPSLCWYNAVVLLKSTDGARTFTHALPPPRHLVAAAPYKYPEFASVAFGYGDFSNVYHNVDDGYLYVFTNSRNDYKAMKAGHCLMRTTPQQISDPTSWRGWGGTSFSVQFINPYTAPSTIDPAEHVCTPLNISFGPHYLGWSNHHNMFIAVGQARIKESPPRQLSMVFSLSADLIVWTEPFLLRVAQSEEGVKEAYPTLLDEVASAGYPNIDRVGSNTSFLYYMHSKTPCQATSFGCRDIWRQSVTFE